jgi:exodeoxyribonuclease V beta subunit
VNVELAPNEFDVCGELPSGVTVLEASAGTGKTYTIAALAARYVAEGLELDRLLVVTFTRIATGELRERVRERLVSVERGLGRVLDGGEAGDDEVVGLLAQADVQLRRERLARAISGFDAATIATTHGFCQEVLGGLGVAGDLEPDVTFVEDLSDLASEVVDDLYVRKFAGTGAPAFGRAEAVEIARAAIDNPSAKIIGEGTPAAELRGRLAHSAREELDRRKRTLAVMTYDDLVTRLGAALRGPTARATAERLRARFDVVLVDEFQDTDPAQWEILQRAFGDTGATLVLIADPKQAIYAFRGADVYAYLEAAAAAATRATLQVNHRSDQGLINAHDALFAGVKLGHEGIAFRPVRAAPGNERSRLSGPGNTTPMRFRIVMRGDPSVSLTPHGYARAPAAREHVARDVAADIVALLDSGTTIAREGGWPPVAPSDLAVLVRTNRQAWLIRDAVAAASVPAVINGAGSVFSTDAAQEWLRLLEALERPAALGRAHSAALTSFVGWPAERLAASGADGAAWERVHARMHDWARVLRTEGVASLIAAVARETDAGAEPTLSARVLGETLGERRLTDLRHVGQLLHVAASEEGLGPSALTAWLRSRIAEAAADAADEERSRRLESDADAVQVLTIHRSKGLEFPIVYVPFLWEAGYIDKQARPIFFHDPAAGDQRTLDVSLDGSAYWAHREQFISEQRGEDLRLAYVALTRARHQTVVWWAGSYDSQNSPLGRLLFSRAESGDVAPSGRLVPHDNAVRSRLEQLEQAAPGCVSVERAALSAPTAWRPPASRAAELAASAWRRALDLRWRRTSYSDITAASHEQWVASEPEEPLIADEPALAEQVEDDGRVAARAAFGQLAGSGPGGREPAAGEGAQRALALAQMPSGVEVGTFVHDVLEATDFAAPNLDAELAARVAQAQARRAVEVGPPAAVVQGLRTVIEAPLGPLLGNARLRDVDRRDRLDELGFELPIGGGDRPTGSLTPARIAAVLRSHLAADDPMAPYVTHLDDPALRQSVRGYLTGSLDLVVRLNAADGPRFAVLDYKTNRLAPPDQELRPWHYRPEAVSSEMHRHHYSLQALLYAVALHRYLRWRLPGYDPAHHLAGVVYLFVRGITGAAGEGIFAWRPPDGLVAALSDALDARDAGDVGDATP